MNIVIPEYEHRTRKLNNQWEIFDPVRKKYVALTPEEFVRQQWLGYLNRQRKVSYNLMRSEMTIKINGLTRRCDIVVYDNNGRPQLLIECKSESEPLNQQVVDQVSRYNLRFDVPFLIVSNGVTHICLRLMNGVYESVSDFQL